ncbi:MAG: type I glyceraldehyde-3-phosphate dehydrogenase [Deltaproteobacteria bacterium]|uniref:Glyceraldehyde-3-phosphate dehydrogenase n=1 Tax=Candidatus Zymogenus saltonus TaxID=2844893 RepID=A0A9D8KH65_9DELT|nr:type I glyceraldehyde-3-phosphate dehydrogenase [Candidatus Zymogenus saltonus]
MNLKVGINGFGRVGRYCLRVILERKNIDVVAVNSRAESRILAHLLKYDSIHGVYDKDIKYDDNSITVDGKKIAIVRETGDLAKIGWGDLGADIVLESTGKFRKRSEAEGHLAGGAKKVLIAAPGKNVDATLVIGVNEDTYDPKSHHVISNASCTTNCLAPIVKILNDSFGIERGLMTTVHSYTMDQRLLDGSHKDLRRARAAALSIVPTTTGAAAAVSLVIPELSGKLDGMALRVPTPNVSLVDFTAQLKKTADVNEINSAVKKAADGKMKGIVKYTEEELVSIDYQSSPYSSIFDAKLTSAIEGGLIKVIAWYDNESGYSERLVDLTSYVGERL